MTLLVAASAFILAVTLHALACRMPLPFGSVMRFVAIGSVCGLMMAVALLMRFGPTAETIGATVAYAFACELYIFLFTLSLSSISANTLAMLSRFPLCRTEFDAMYDERKMAALRIERLLSSGLVQERESLLFLTPKGKLIARAASLLRAAFAHGS